MKCTRKSVEWDELRLTSSSKYVNEYMYDKDNIRNCECCQQGKERTGAAVSMFVG